MQSFPICHCKQYARSLSTRSFNATLNAYTSSLMKAMCCGTAQSLALVTTPWKGLDIGSPVSNEGPSFIKADSILVCSAFTAAAELHSCIDHQNALTVGHQWSTESTSGVDSVYEAPSSSSSELHVIVLQLPTPLCSNIIKHSCLLFSFLSPAPK